MANEKDSLTKQFIHINHSEREINMCQAIEDMRNEAMEQGLEKGIKKGIKGIVEILRSMNVGNEEICEKIMATYDLSREDAERYASAVV